MLLNKDIPKDVKKMFDTSNYESERPLPLPKGKNKIDIGLMIKNLISFWD